MKIINQLKKSLILAAVIPCCLAQAIELSSLQRSEADKLRDQRSKPEQVLAFAGVEKGMVIADILGGSGYYSEILSHVVGEQGKVYLHNNKAYLPWVGEQLSKRLADNRLPNVVRHDRETTQLDLAAESLDQIFFIMGYHDIYHVAPDWKIDKSDFLTQLKTALKPGGRLVVIDHDATTGSGIASSQELHRIDENYVVKDLTEQGFVLVKRSEFLKNKDDKLNLSALDNAVRGKTSRFVLLFEKQK